VFEDEDEGEAFVVALAHWESGSLTDGAKSKINARAESLTHKVEKGHDLRKWRFWQWLSNMADGRCERHTVSFF